MKGRRPPRLRSRHIEGSPAVADLLSITYAANRGPQGHSKAALLLLALLMIGCAASNGSASSASSSSSSSSSSAASGLERPKYRTVYACEGGTLNMECEPDHVINLIRANYGRFSITICNEHGNTEWSVNCMSLRSHRVLHDRCSQKQNCSVAASTRGFGDPCPGTLKYLEAHFQCIPVNPPSHASRPRPPWFPPAKSTLSSIPSKGEEQHGGGQQIIFSSHQENLFPKDTRHGGFPPIPSNLAELDSKERHKEHLVPSKSTSSTTTTTLRPPPWLITNSPKNMTSFVTTVSVSTTPSSSSSSTISTTPTSSRTRSPLHPSKGTVSSSSKNEEPSNKSPPSHRVLDQEEGTRNKEGNARVPSRGTQEEEVERESSWNQQEEEEQKELPDQQQQRDHAPRKKPVDFFASSSTTPSTTTLWVSQDLPGRGSTGETSWCAPSSGRGIFWNWTRSGEVAVQPCPGGASGWATRPCDPDGWVSPPDLGECRSVWLTALMSREEAKDAVLSIIHDLTKVTESRALYGGDITATARLLNSLTSRMAGDVSNFPDAAQREALVTELVMRAMTTGSNLLGKQISAWGDLRASEHRAAVTELLLGMEETAFLLADNLYREKSLPYQVPNILMRIEVLETRNVGPIRFPNQEDVWPLAEEKEGGLAPTNITPQSTLSQEPEEDSVPSPSLNPSEASYPEAPVMGGGLASPRSPLRHLEDFIIIPPEAMLENSENGLVKIVFFTYDGLEKLLQPERSFGYVQGTFKPLNKTTILNSRVVSASLGAGRHIELSEPVVITFKMLRTVNVTNPVCVFWDYPTSTWSSEGCHVMSYNISHTVCRCGHLTNFAVLMDVHATPLPTEHKVALSIITYVGCVISIVCLLLATIVFHAFRGLKNDRTTIHKNLCICLMLGEAIFLGGISRTGDPIVCGIIAGLLHYFFLAAFAWMFLEGFQLYVMLIEVFEAEKSRVRWYYATAYCFPALVVAISAVIDPYSYGTEQICWLRTDNYFIFAFVGPVLLVLLANSVFLCLSLILMCRHASNSAALKNKEQSRIDSLRSWIRGAIVLMFLLGLTWTFGLLYLDRNSVAMAYIFTVLNSLQGLFIFVFHCIKNDKKYSFKSCGRDSGHGGSEQEESPRAVPPSKLGSLRLNNNLTPRQNNEAPNLVNPFAAAAALESGSSPTAGYLPDYRLASEPSSLLFHAPPPPPLTNPRSIHRNQSPWNHTYTEIPDGAPVRTMEASSVDPVYEEIEREVRSEIQVSDLSDEDGRRQNSDISRQSSRSYGDHRPLLPYTLTDRGPPNNALMNNDSRFQRLRHAENLHLVDPGKQAMPGPAVQHLDHTIVSAGHMVPLVHPSVSASHALSHGNGHIVTHQGPVGDFRDYSEGVMPSLGTGGTIPSHCSGSIVQPLSEPNLRSWEAVQRHRDLQQLQHLGEMTVAVLSGEQVVCKLKSPLAPIHENSSSQATTVATGTPGPPGSGTSERYLVPQTYSHC